MSGNGAARGQRRQARAAPAAQHAVDRVVMDKGATPAASSRKAFRQHAHDCRKVLLPQRPVGPGAPEPGVELILVPVLRRHFGDDLLRQHVKRRLQNRECVELATPHAVEQRRAFHKIVARKRKLEGGSLRAVARAG